MKPSHDRDAGKPQRTRLLGIPMSPVARARPWNMIKLPTVTRTTNFPRSSFDCAIAAVAIVFPPLWLTLWASSLYAKAGMFYSILETHGFSKRAHQPASMVDTLLR